MGSVLTDSFPVVDVENAVSVAVAVSNRKTECEEQSKPDITQAGGPTTTTNVTTTTNTTAINDSKEHDNTEVVFAQQPQPKESPDGTSPDKATEAHPTENAIVAKERRQAKPW